MLFGSAALYYVTVSVILELETEQSWLGTVTELDWVLWYNYIHIDCRVHQVEVYE